VLLRYSVTIAIFRSEVEQPNKNCQNCTTPIKKWSKLRLLVGLASASSGLLVVLLLGTTTPDLPS